MIINMTGGGGGAGATLVVTGVVGSICTVSKDTKTYTKTFGTDAKATFKGLTTGTWTVTMTNGTQTAVKTIVINVDYALTIAYFSATINVTYPSGATCTASDGSTTLTAPDTTGTWACVVPNTGEWTVSCIDGTQTASKTVSITADGQSASVVLSYNHLFRAGDGALVKFDTASEDDASVSITNSAITTNFTSAANPRILIITHDSIDLTERTTLNVRSNVTEVFGQGGPYGGIIAVFSPTATVNNMLDPDNNDSRIVAKSEFSVKNGIFSVDLTSLTGNYKIGIKGGLKSATTEIYFV